MSARQDLIDALWRSGDEGAKRLVDAYAHELAEKIRESEAPSKLAGFYGAELSAYLEGSDDAADLIDPEVSDG